MEINTDVRSRQAELVDDSILTQPITIIGCGAIGSFTALVLAKMGFHDLNVYDNDVVSTENISNQFFRYEDIGTNKALALFRMLYKFEDIEIHFNERNWTREDTLRGTVVMAVDSMGVRQQIYDRINGNRGVWNFLDGRMGGQQAEIYAFRNTPEQRAVYERYLWAEEEASELRCTQKAVMYNVLWIASGIANTLRLMLERKAYHDIVLMDFENQEQHKVLV
jgi:hypothetical protein